MVRFIDNAIAVGVLVVVVFTALAVGTVEPWSVAVFELIVVSLVLLWGLKAVGERRLTIRMPAAGWPLASLVVLGLAQSVAIGGPESGVHSLSMDVEATRGAVTVILFLFVLFVIAATFFTARERLRALGNFLVIYGLALAVFALVQHFTWEGELFWMRPTTAAGAGTGGPFVNRNHFAGYMEMLIPIAVAMALLRRARLESRLFYGFAAAIMGIAEAASLSRGGMISLFAGLLFIAAVSAGKRDRSPADGRAWFKLHPAYVVILMVAVILIGVVWIGADLDILRRIANDPLTGDSAMSRPGIWRDTLRIFLANPLTGAGLGAFETVYPIYGRGDGSLLIQFAHNDYLQILSDGGLVGAVVALWFIAVIARATVSAARRSDSLSRALGLGSAAGMFALLVHSLFDFNLQIPSNALLFLILTAIVSGAAVASDAHTEPGSRPRIHERAATAPAMTLSLIHQSRFCYDRRGFWRGNHVG